MTCGAFGQTAATTTAITGGITGAVQAADGKGVSHILVAIRVRPGTAGTKVQKFNTDVITDKDGGFIVSSVPNGFNIFRDRVG